MITPNPESRNPNFRLMRFHKPSRIIGLLDLTNFIPPNSTGVEVGSWLGESAIIFAESGRIQSLTCIDTWQQPEIERAFDLNTEPYPVIQKKKLAGTIATRLFQDESLDFVYIDGNHKYSVVKDDIDYWLPKIKPDGLICGHDYDPKYPGVIQAVLMILGKPDLIFGDTSWLKFKNRLNLEFPLADWQAKLHSNSVIARLGEAISVPHSES